MIGCLALTTLIQGKKMKNPKATKKTYKEKLQSAQGAMLRLQTAIDNPKTPDDQRKEFRRKQILLGQLTKAMIEDRKKARASKDGSDMADMQPVETQAGDIVDAVNSSQSAQPDGEVSASNPEGERDVPFGSGDSEISDAEKSASESSDLGLPPKKSQAIRPAFKVRVRQAVGAFMRKAVGFFWTYGVIMVAWHILAILNTGALVIEPQINWDAGRFNFGVLLQSVIYMAIAGWKNLTLDGDIPFLLTFLVVAVYSLLPFILALPIAVIHRLFSASKGFNVYYGMWIGWTAAACLVLVGYNFIAFCLKALWNM